MAERRRGLGRGIGALIPSAQRESKDRPIDVFFGSGVTSTGRESGKSPSSKQEKAKKSASPKTVDDSNVETVENPVKVEGAAKKSSGKRRRPSSGDDSSKTSSSSPLREGSEETGKGKDTGRKEGTGGKGDTAGKKKTGKKGDAGGKENPAGKKDTDKGRSPSRETVVVGTAAIEDPASDNRADAGEKAVNVGAKVSGDFEEASENEVVGKAASQDVEHPVTQRTKRMSVTTNVASGATDEFAEATATPETVVERAGAKPAEFEPVGTVVERAGAKPAESEPMGAVVVEPVESEPIEPKSKGLAGSGEDSTGDGTREGLNQSLVASFDGEVQTSPADSRGSEGMHSTSAVERKTSVRAFDQAGAVEFSEEVPSVDVRQNRTKDSKSSASRDSSTSGTTQGEQETADSATRPVAASADASSRVDSSGEDGHSSRAEVSEARDDVDAAVDVENRAVDEDGNDKSELGGGNGPVESDAGQTGGAGHAQNEQGEADEGLVEVPGATYAELPLDQIIPNTRQPRNVFDEEELEELAASIREVGVLQPVIVRPLAAPIPGQSKARYELIMGERRWRASELAGIETVPAIIRHTQDEDLLRDALLENLHRAELNPLEEAAAYQQLLEDFQCTQEELSRRIVRSRPQISNTLRLLKLPPLVQRRVAAGVLSSGHARALLGLSDPGAMERLAQKIVSEGLSVRQVEEIVALGDEPTASPASGRRRARRYGPELGELSSRLADRFDTRVKVEMGAKKGSIKIDFASIDDLNRILGVLSPGETGVDITEQKR